MNDLWIKTPLVYSSRLSKRLGCQVYLKLENLQPSGSFKSRGISLFVQHAKERHGPDVHLIIASGGNAGLAAACASRILGLKCTVFIPEGATQSTIALLRDQDADVVIKGAQYSDAVEAAKQLHKLEPNSEIVPAYDNDLVKEGHASMVHEMKEQLNEKPDAILCSVGGAGLLGGILVGTKQLDWDDVPVISLETFGSNCFHLTMALNTSNLSAELPMNVHEVYNQDENIKVAHFSSFNSKASGSLGASEPSGKAVSAALRRGKVTCVSVEDELSMKAAVGFAEDHRMVVELACATTLAPAYCPSLWERLIPDGPTRKEMKVIFVVCGGSKVSIKDLSEYDHSVGSHNSRHRTWRSLIETEEVELDK